MRTHRRTVAGIAATVLAAALSGCGSTVGLATTPEPTPEAPTETYDGPTLGDTVEYDLFTTFSVDDPRVGTDGSRQWLDVRLEVTAGSFGVDALDLALVCSGNNRVGQFLLGVATPSPAFPITAPLASDSVTEGYVSLGLPQSDEGGPVESCTTGSIGIVGLPEAGGSSDLILLPEDVAAELVPQRG